jgi:hypothetical protein
MKLQIEGKRALKAARCGMHEACLADKLEDSE